MLKRDMAFIGAMTLPAVFFISVVSSVAVNIPIGDDYDTILGFLNSFLSSDDFFEKARLVFTQHNEHRLAFGNVVTLIQYYLFGGADLRALIIFGNLSVVALAVLLAVISRERAGSALYLLPVGLVIFNFQYYETINWAMAAVSNLYVLFFALLSFCLLLSRPSQAFFVGALVCYLLAAFTQGSGLFVGVAGAVSLLLVRDFKRALVLGVFSSVLFAAYFYGYTTPEGHPSLFAVLGVTPLAPLRFFFSLLGSVLPLPEAFGLFSFGYFVYLTYKGYYRTNKVAYAFLLFLFITAATASLTRSGFGIDQSLSSRYRVISTLIFAMHYLAAIEVMRQGVSKKILIGLFLTGALVFNISAYLSGRPELDMRKRVLTYGFLMWQENGTGLIYPSDEKAGAILIRSARMRTYLARPDISSVSAKRADLRPTDSTGSVDFRLDNAFAGRSAIFIDGWAYSGQSGPQKGRTYVVLRSDEREYVFDASVRNRPDLVEYLGDARLEDAGFFTYIPRSEVQAGTYRVGLLIDNGGYVLTDDVVSF